MKRCLNRNCNSTFLYGDDKNVCPFCHQRLTKNDSSAANSDRNIVSLDEILVNQEEERTESQAFTRQISNGTSCHGRITEMDHHEVFSSKWHKLMNAVIRNEPYQFAHQTSEYTIRVENITDGYPTEIMDFCLFGNYLGRLQVGDEVTVEAKDYGDRRVVKKIYNHTTASSVKPGIQIPAWVIKMLAIVLLLALITLICSIVWLFKSGAVVKGLSMLVTALMPLFVVVFLISFAFGKVFSRSGRRRRFWNHFWT